MRKYTCCFAGHKLVPADQRDEIENQLTVTIEELIAKGIIFYSVGCSDGFDSMAARCVIKLREKHPQIALVLVLPYKSSSLVAGANYAAILSTISRDADKIVYLNDNPVEDGLWKRNQHLVNNSCCCVFYCTKTKSETARTVAYAKNLGIDLINIADKLK